MKMNYVVALCRMGVLNSKSKHFLSFGHLPNSKFKNTISHKVHALKSSTVKDISIISFPIKNLPGKSCGQRKKKIQSNA